MSCFIFSCCSGVSRRRIASRWSVRAFSEAACRSDTAFTRAATSLVVDARRVHRLLELDPGDRQVGALPNGLLPAVVPDLLQLGRLVRAEAQLGLDRRGIGPPHPPRPSPRTGFLRRHDRDRSGHHQGSCHRQHAERAWLSFLLEGLDRPHAFGLNRQPKAPQEDRPAPPEPQADRPLSRPHLEAGLPARGGRPGRGDPHRRPGAVRLDHERGKGAVGPQGFAPQGQPVPSRRQRKTAADLGSVGHSVRLVHRPPTERLRRPRGTHLRFGAPARKPHGRSADEADRVAVVGARAGQRRGRLRRPGRAPGPPPRRVRAVTTRARHGNAARIATAQTAPSRCRSGSPST